MFRLKQSHTYTKNKIAVEIETRWGFWSKGTPVHSGHKLALYLLWFFFFLGFLFAKTNKNKLWKHQKHHKCFHNKQLLLEFSHHKTHFWNFFTTNLIFDHNKEVFYSCWTEFHSILRWKFNTFLELHLLFKRSWKHVELNEVFWKFDKSKTFKSVENLNRLKI